MNPQTKKKAHQRGERGGTTKIISNGKREFVPRDQFFPLIVAYCLLLLLKNKEFHASFIQKDKNCSGQFLTAYFLFWEFLNLNLTFVVYRKPDP